MFFQIFFIFFMMLQQNTHRWFKFSFRVMHRFACDTGDRKSNSKAAKQHYNILH